MPPDSKKRKQDDETQISSQADSSMGEEVAVREPQTGGSTPGGTGSSVVATIITNPDLKNLRHSFRKTFQVYTGGLQFSRLTKDALPTALKAVFQDGISIFQTPLAVVDPNVLPFFMDRAQWSQLPPWTFAKTARIKVIPVGIRLPFGTNDPASTYANSQTLVQCVYGMGINKQHNCIVGPLEFDTTDSTKAVSINDDFDFESMLYGKDGSIGCCMGVPRHLNNYLSLVIGNQTNYSPNGLSIYNVQNVLDCKGCPLLQLKYDYKFGLLYYPNTNTGVIQRSVLASEIPGGCQPRAFGTISGDGTYQQAGEKIYSSWTSTVAQGANLLSIDFNSPVEKSAYMTSQIDQPLTPDAPPVCAFGAMPVQSNPVNASAPTFSPACIIWQIETELDIEVITNFLNSGIQKTWIGHFDPIWGRNELSSTSVATTQSTAYISGRAVKDNQVYNSELIGPVNPRTMMYPVKKKLFT